MPQGTRLQTYLFFRSITKIFIPIKNPALKNLFNYKKKKKGKNARFHSIVIVIPGERKNLSNYQATLE